MSIRHVCTASAAAVLTVSMAAFGQTTGQTPTQTSGQAGSQAMPQERTPGDRAQTETQVTLVGCLQREADYRKQQSAGRGGVAASGMGLNNEFILINASKSTGTSAAAAGTPTAPTGTSTAATGAGTPTTAAETPTGTAGIAAGAEAYELTGDKEKDLSNLAGRRVEITGTLKSAKTGEAGTPTGGFDPLKQDLKLFEVNVISFREISGNCAQSPESSAAATQPATREEPERAAAEPAPQAQAAEPASQRQAAAPAREPQAVGTSGAQDELPRTASPLPLAGLIGLLSLGGAIAIRSLRK
jgi:hypothetical protein